MSNSVFPLSCHLPHKYLLSSSVGGAQESIGCAGLVLRSCRELLGLSAARVLIIGLVAGGGEGDICDEAEALGGPVMHVTALTLQQGLRKSVHHGRSDLDHFT